MASRHLIAILIVLTPVLGAVLPADAELPSHFYYFDERQDWELVPNRLLVRYAEEMSPQERIAVISRAGVAVREAVSETVSRWEHLELLETVGSPEEADALIETLLRLPEVDFVTPVFVDESGFDRIVLSDILIRFRPDFRGRPADWLLRHAPGLRITEQRIGTMPDAYRLDGSFRNGFRVLAEANRLARLPEIKWAEPDMLVAGTPEYIPNDPSFSQQWALRNTGGALGGLRDADMGADVAWEITTGSSDVKVLILDSGVEQSHPDITQLPGADFLGAGSGGPLTACDNHGTAVAGCPSGTIDNSLGVVGVAPGVNVLSGRNCQEGGCGPPQTCTTSGTAHAITWAFDQGGRVSNWSWTVGGSGVVVDAYEATRDGGMVHFTSAGNSGNPIVGFPGSLPIVYAISNVDKFGNLSPSSNWGPDIEFAAPGSDVTTTDRSGALGYGSGGIATVSGTSFSSPYAAGVAALVVSMNPDRTADRVQRVMRRTAMDYGPQGRDDQFGYGFVNANSAVRFPTRRVSLVSNGNEANDGSGQPAISETGRHIVLATDATNLGPGDDNSARDVVAHDRETARTQRLSRRSDNTNGNGPSEGPTISRDGRWVAFQSEATNLATGDGNGVSDIFLRDRDTDMDGIFDETGAVATTRVSLTELGAEATGGGSRDASISGDGTRIAFTSDATNLVSGDGNLAADVFLRDLGSGTTVLVSEASGGGFASGASGSAAMSADGNHVAFQSDAPDLVSGDSNGNTDVFVHDLTLGTTVRVSVATGGGQGTGASTEPAISEDGRYVVFTSTAADLIGTDGNTVSDVFLHDRDPDGNGTFDEGNGTTVRVSVASDGSELGEATAHPGISYDGQQIIFQRDDSGGPEPRVYVHNTTNGATFLVSKSSLGDPGTGYEPVMSGNGLIIAYSSNATNLVPSDGNVAQDVFLFQDNPCNLISFTVQPVDVVADLGTPVTLFARANGSSPFYQWRKNGVDIPGATQLAYTIAALAPEDLGTYDVVASNHCDSVTSDAISLQTSTTGVDVAAAPTPANVVLDRPAPSPFGDRTSIRFGLPQAAEVTVDIHDVGGRRVARLLDGARGAGWHYVSWDGRDDLGSTVSSGIFFVRLVTDERVETRKILKVQ